MSNEVTAIPYTEDVSAEIQRLRQELRAARRSEGDLRTALDEHAIVAITDASGKITFANDKFCAISKYSREELIGQDHRIINSGLHGKEYFHNLWTTITHGKVWHGEIRNRAKDGSLYWVDTTIVPFLNEAGKPRQYVAIRADITARKQTELALEESRLELEQKVRERTAELQAAKEHAESADRLKSEFLATMSHELRTPLNGIIGFTELLAGGRPGPLNPKQSQYVNEVIRSGRHLLQLINDVLDLSKVEAGRMELFPEELSLGTVLEEVSGSVRTMADQKRISLHTRVEPHSERVYLDRKKLVQVLYNLVSNALKFTNDGGRVEMTAERLSLGEIVIKVKDTGIGIRAEDFEKLFIEFQQLDSGNARRFQGTGLGLALTKKLVVFQGGTITVESVVGQGSTFIVTLPSKDVAASP